MKKLLEQFWTEDKYRRLIHAMGGVIFFGNYGVIIYFFIMEAPAIWKEGLSSFFADLLIRLVLGIIFGGIALLPYYIGSVASKRLRLSALFFVVCLGVFILDVWLRIYVLFFPDSSTASLALVFSPFSLAVPVALVWGFVSLRRLASNKMSSSR